MNVILDTCDKALRYAVLHAPLLEPVSADRLTGGYCNYVYRIRCRNAAWPGATPAAATADADAPCSNVILKNYPPHLAANPSVAMSVDRCCVELTALQQQQQQARAQLEPPASLCRVPRVAHADPQAAVIIMEDAGDRLVSLLDALTWNHVLESSSAATQLPTAAAQDPDPAQLLPGAWPGMTAALLAQALADYLTALAPMGEDPVFENPAAWAALARVYGGARDALADRFPDNPRLSAFVSRAPALAPPPPTTTRSLILGDTWPNTIHFDAGSRTIWLLDWEMARRGAPRDDADQLLDNLWIMAQNPDRYRGQAVRGLIAQLQLRYCGGRGCDWRAGREAAFVRRVAMLASFPHWGLAAALPAVMRRAVQEAEEVERQREAEAASKPTA